VTTTAPSETAGRRSVRRWVRRGFLLWAVIALTWLANSVRTQGVPDEVLRDSQEVIVRDGSTVLEFRPTRPRGKAALIFICGSGIHPHAYAPLLRPIAEAGYSVSVVKLPWRFAPRDSDKEEAVDRARSLIAAHPEATHWVVAGHSLGGALAARVAQQERGRVAALVLVGTTHPKEDDLSRLDMVVTKVYATKDGVAPVDRVMANKRLLPRHTQWVQIEGGNHSQFGNYGHQLFDGTATIGRAEQQALTREALLRVLREDRN
jgi:pimeloyl-ACP methyl ester carboxylesterase